VGDLSTFNAFRDDQFSSQNRYLGLAGLDIRIDGRSHHWQGIDPAPITCTWPTVRNPDLSTPRGALQ